MATINFGKHRGTNISDLPSGYCAWLLSLVDGDSGASRFAARNEAELRGRIEGEATRNANELLTGVSLNCGQQAAVDAISASLLLGDASAMRLEGGAGYGKSFTVAAVVAAAVAAGYVVRATATSYVATQVLASQLTGFEVRTMASMLRLAKVELEDQEEYQVSQQTTDRISELLAPKTLLIVDEYSMVGDELGQRLLDGLSTGGKLLAVGDLKQLPPVKQSSDSVLATIPAHVRLTQPMRYSEDSDLFALEQDVRGSGRIDMSTYSDCDNIYVHKGFKGLLRAFVADSLARPEHDHRMLFFRRADVLNANRHIRSELHGALAAAASPVLDDERLMVMSTSDLPTVDPVRVQAAMDAGRDKATRRFYSGQTFQVEFVEEGEVAGVPCYLVTFAGDPTEYPVVFAAGTSHTMEGMRGSEEYSDRAAALRTEALETGQWGDWREFVNSFLTVGYNYAMTVHRCQGQSIDRVYFAPQDLQAGSLTAKLTYVAATRAKREVHLAA